MSHIKLGISDPQTGIYNPFKRSCHYKFSPMLPRYIFALQEYTYCRLMDPFDFRSLLHFFFDASATPMKIIISVYSTAGVEKRWS